MQRNGKLISNFPLLQKGIITIRKQGFSGFFDKARHYLLRTYTKNYSKWIKKNSITDQRIEEIKNEIANFKYNYTISIIMPVYNVDKVWLEKAIDSVINQIYENWELCIVDDASTKKEVKKTLEEYSNKDSRIKVIFLKKNSGISGASNKALTLATGEFIGLLDNDDELSTDALFENIKLINKHPDINMIYSDEDKLKMNGKRCEPFFKPDWSPHMLLSCMYIGHFGVYRKKIVDEIGGFRIGYEGSQDYDLVLRFTEKTDKIFHLPKILYHWRKIPGSAAFAEDSKSYAYVSAKKALKDAMKRRNIPSKIYDGQWTGSYRIKYEIIEKPTISILIPTKDQISLLRKCINSILYNNSYNNYEILIIDNNSIEPETFEYFSVLSSQKNIRIIDYKNSFNFSAINNYGVLESKGNVLLFLKNNCEIRDKDSINSMIEHIQKKDVGAVGAKLFFSDNTLKHCGLMVLLSDNRIAGCPSYGDSETFNGYCGRNNIVHNVSAITDTAMMIRREVFNEVNGFDEKLELLYREMDFCLKLRERGYLIVFTPYAKFYHHESFDKSYGKKTLLRNDMDYFQVKWKKILEKEDPYFNPNLTLNRNDFSIKLL